MIGPVEIPTGTYRVTATTIGFMIADVETLSGECDTTQGVMFNLMSGQANSGVQTLLSAEDCSASISISNTREPWTLTIVQILPSDAVPLQQIYSSETLMTPVIGPVEIPAGTYRATATTTGYMIVAVEPLDGTCGHIWTGLFNLSSGEASTGVQEVITFEECLAMIVIRNVWEPWTLEFELQQ